MDELRKRCEDAAWGVVLDDPFEVRIDELNMVKVVDAVLAEIERTHYVISREWMDRQPVTLVQLDGELVLIPSDAIGETR